MEATREGVSRFFVTKERDNGEEFVCLNDAAPRWLREAVREAHGEELPNDWVYGVCRDAVDAIEEGYLEPEEFAEGQVDIYTGALLGWATPHRIAIAEEYCRDIGEVLPDVARILAWGQYAMARDIFETMHRALDANAA